MSRLARMLATTAAAVLVLGLTTDAGAAPASQSTTQAALVAVSATHVQGLDRIVMTFKGGLPTQRSLRWVDQMPADAAGRPLRVAGHRFFVLDVSDAVAHGPAGRTVASSQTYNLPNITQSVIAGDVEGVVELGVGVQRHTVTRMYTLSSPSRVVVDLAVPYQTQRVKTWFFNADLFASGAFSYRIERSRPVIAPAVERQALERLFAGPTLWELAHGYRFVTSRATGFTDLRIADGVARVRLTGACYSGGSTFTVATEIMPTLKQFDTVDHVKVYGPKGYTEKPGGTADSIPPCLEP